MNDLQMIQTLLAEAPPSEEAVAAGRERLRSTYRRRAFYIPRPTWPVLAGLGVAATAAVAALAVGISGTTPRAPDPGHATQIQLSATYQTLEKAAHAAEGRPQAEPKPHQWLYIKSVESQPGQRTSTDDEWMTFDGIHSAYHEGGKLVTHTSPTTAAISDASPMGTYDTLRKLPADPQTLLPVLYKVSVGQVPGRGTDRDSQAWANIVQLLWNSPVAAPPRIQAAIFRALTKIPGMRTEQVKDVLGRPAIGLYRPGLTHAYLLLDPHTYQVIGRLNISTGAPTKQKKIVLYPAGTVTWSIVRTAVPVGGPGQR
ncbi:MAG: hypothetical protein JWN52_6515 [Actinomycetia bacterium]|nr:hypothetical protein [Actinomycetes bacterium]